MRLTPDQFAVLVAEAALSPSVHNTQPTRWRLESNGAVLVLEACCRLPVGDPAGRDADVSHGAAIEGFALACSATGRALTMAPLNGPVEDGLRTVARLTLTERAGPADPLYRWLSVRRTYRGAFDRRAAPDGLSSLTQADDVRLVTGAAGVARIAALNDAASLRTFQDGPYRAELLSWMRLSRRHPMWALDGLNAEAMEMSAVEAAGAGMVLRPGVFETLERLGVAKAFVAEAPVVRSAHAIVLFHRPEGEPPLQTGRRFHRLWLELTGLGVSAGPMAVLADDADTRAVIAREFDIPAGRRLITAFRVGAAPKRDLGPKPRLPVSDLLA